MPHNVIISSPLFKHQLTVHMTVALPTLLEQVISMTPVKYGTITTHQVSYDASYEIL